MPAEKRLNGDTQICISSTWKLRWGTWRFYREPCLPVWGHHDQRVIQT